MHVSNSDSLQARLPLAVASAKGDEEAWDQVAATINVSAADTVGFARSCHRPWISDETLEAVDLAKDKGE